MVKPSQMDPRHLLPSRADPEHRKIRKELEKNSPIGFTEPLLLGLLGVGLIWNMEYQVEKYQKRKEKKENEGKDQDDRRRARSSRRPPPSSSSRSRRGDGQDYDDRYNRDDGYYKDEYARQAELDRYYRPARGYDRDHYYYDYRDDEYSRGPRKTDRYNPDDYDVEAAQVSRGESISSTTRRQYWVDGVDGEPRYERRGRESSVSTSREDGRSEHASATPAGDSASRYGGSAKLGSQYDDGFEKKRFDGLPTEAPGPTTGDDVRTRTSERRSRRSRRDSF